VAISRLKLDEKATSLGRINDIIYACQVTYDEVTERPKKENNWRQGIENKIAKLDQRVQRIKEHNQNEVPTHEMTQMCMNSAIHSNDEDKVQKLKDQLEEKRDSYKKKLVIAENRTKFRQTNKMFEFNRKMFYRNLNEEKAEIDENIDNDKTSDFWRQIWKAEESDAEEYQELIQLMEPMELQVESGASRMKELIEERVRYLPNWKTPGPDQVYNFFIKRLHSLHQRLVQVITEAIANPELIEKDLYIGNTYLIPKVKRAKEAKELRPITCLPNMYKLLSKVVTTLLTNMCEVNGTISANQLGTKRGHQGAKQQALLSKVINKEHDNLLFTSWIDVQKAYDSVQHGYLMDVLKSLNIPANIIGFVGRMMELQQTKLICGKQVIARVRIERGLLQGDSLSPLLFVLALEPLSRMLNRCCEKVAVGNIERNHLIFIDDIKLLAHTEETLKELCHYTDECLRKMGLRVNQAKSASNIEDEQVFGDKLDDIQGYKYLGVLEDSRNMIKPENKRLLEDRIKDRTTKLCQTKLNAVNLFRGINEYALSTVNYYIGLLPYEPKELEEIDKDVRRILAAFKVTRQAANMDRLYLKRDRLGRGLACQEEKSEVMLLKLHEFLSKNPETTSLVEQERREGTHLGLIREYLKVKYMLNDDEINAKEIQDKQEQKRLGKIKAKRMHGLLFADEDNVFDRKSSSLWLTKGNISSQQEGMYCKLQDRNLYFGGETRCPHCKQGPKSVEHLATHCGRMLNFDYKKRHDEVVRCLHFQYAKMYGLNKNKKLKNYKVQNVISNERVKIKSDVPILTELRVDHNKPDLMIHDLRTKEITLVEVGITNKNILATTELTKSRKYELLANELKCIHPGTKVTIIPVVLTWDGLVTRYFQRYMRQLQVSDKLQAYIQTVVLKRTCESILIDCQKEQRGDWLEEEMSDLMERFETEGVGSE
jgi:hypothetical protein